MSEIEPSRNKIEDHLLLVINDLFDNYKEYGIDENKINIQDLSLLLKSNFKVHEFKIKIDNKIRNILTYIKRYHGGLLKYIKTCTQLKVTRDDDIILIFSQEDSG
tara:strand:- start:209 stop:523 length:315 start_codon:yes stop_codon:yes gene_type:complete